MSRDNNFLAIRLFFASAVLLSHSYELIHGTAAGEPLFSLVGITLGRVAVIGFFVLSGFLLVQSWKREPLLTAFLRKRSARIFPGFLVASAICLFVIGPIGAADPFAYLQDLSGKDFIRPLLLLAPTSPPVFTGQPFPTLNGAMWTVSYEFRCYLILAAIGCAARHRFQFFVIPCLGIAALLSLLPLPPLPKGSILFPVLGEPHHLVALAFSFLVGASLSQYANFVRSKRAAAASIALLALSASLPNVGHLFAIPAFSILLLAFAFTSVPSLDFVKQLPDFSYGLYLYGWPAQKLIAWWIPSISPIGLFATSLVVASVAGLASWFLIESPALRYASGLRGSLHCRIRNLRPRAVTAE